MKNYKIVALICCRGGSKGIANKNIKKFAGKPLLTWILDSARKASVFDDIILSTDSEEIARVGKEFPTTIPGLRPAHLAQDDSDQFDTHKHIFSQLKIRDDTHRVCILNNNPFIDENLIRKSYHIATKHEFKRLVLDSIRVNADYVHWRQSYQDNGKLYMFYPDQFRKSTINRQAIEPCYTPINNIRWGIPSMLESYEAFKKEIIRNGVVPCMLPRIKNFDIDNKKDWIIAETVFKLIHNEGIS